MTHSNAKLFIIHRINANCLMSESSTDLQNQQNSGMIYNEFTVNEV